MKDIYLILADLGIAYIKHEHPPVFTCGEAERVYKNVKGGNSKNLFLRNKKGKKHYLVIVESSKKINIKDVARLLDEPDLGFASPERLMKYLGVMPGSVTPFGLVHDENKEIVVVIDKDLWQHDRLHYHPLVNTATLELSREDFQKFLNWCGNPVKFLDL